MKYANASHVQTNAPPDQANDNYIHLAQREIDFQIKSLKKQ